MTEHHLSFIENLHANQIISNEVNLAGLWVIDALTKRMSEFTAPTIAPSETGNLVFSWQGFSYYFDIEISATGNIECYAERNDGEDRFYTEILMGDDAALCAVVPLLIRALDEVRV
jgi:hypothetical protein